MHEESPILKGQKRDRLGSRYARRDRDRGLLPAVVYGHKQDPVAVSVDAKEALSHFHKGEKVFRLQIGGGETETILLKEVQFDHLGTNVIHADFARVNLDERVNTSASIHLVGDAKGLKKGGAVLMHTMNEIELECLVTNLPDAIEVDISDLDVGDSIHAKDVKLPKPTMVLLSDPEAVVVHIVEARAEETTDEAAEVSTDAQPEVLTEKKPEDD